MKVGRVITNLSGDLCCHNLRFSGDQGLTNFPRFFITLLFRNRIVGCYRNRLTALSGNIDTLLSLEFLYFYISFTINYCCTSILTGTGTHFSVGTSWKYLDHQHNIDIPIYIRDHWIVGSLYLAYLLTVVATTVVLQVGNPALHVFYRLNQSWIFMEILCENFPCSPACKLCSAWSHNSYRR